MKFSIIIPTHNPRADYLQKILTSLSNQSLPRTDWELIVVDNRSTPSLLSDALPQLGVRTILIREERIGLAYARIAGIEAALGDAVVLVDDDNLLTPDYLECAAQFLDANPHVGALGGIVKPEFEALPPSWLKEHYELLALRNLGASPVISNWKEADNAYPWCAPFGAGMVIRRSCASTYVESTRGKKNLSIDRQGKKLLSCGDCEIIIIGVLRAGFEVAYVPHMQLFHLIPASRLKFCYLSRLAFYGGVSWGEFCVRYGFWKSVPRWTIPLRIVKFFFKYQAWHPSGWLHWRSWCGRLIGQSYGRPLS